MFDTVIKYIVYNKLIFVAGAYFLFSALLKAFMGIDICIPCLWKTLFGLSCPGCGITSAFTYLLKLDIMNAVKSNWLIIVILPMSIYFLKVDFEKFKKCLVK